MNESYQGVVLSRSGVRAPSVSLPFVIALVVILICVLLEVYWLSSLGIGVFTYCLVRALLEAGVDLPIESFILLMASSQWIIGPVLAYAGLSDHWKYHMYIPETDYMTLVVPAVICYSLGLYGFRSSGRILLTSRYAEATRQTVRQMGYLPFYLIGIGIVFSFLVDLLPASLAFPAYILSNLKYIGVVYLIFSGRKEYSATVLVVAFLLTFFTSLRTSMFHDLILWSAFIGMYAAYVLKPDLAKKIGMVLLGLAFIFVIQAVKDTYRNRLLPQGETQQISKFIASIEERFEDDERLKAGNVERMVVRLNQGWIISRIMEQVPSYVPFAEGETIQTAVKASILPRILYPDKPLAGGRDNYMKYTGFYLQPGTSMSISLIGEAYINYGVTGAWLFMFIFGLFSSFAIRKIFLLGVNYPTIWLWFPLIMFHFVKAETELLVQLNFLVKSLLLVYLFLWANKHFLRLKL